MLRKFVRASYATALIAVLPFLTGCGGSTNVADKSNPPAKGADTPAPAAKTSASLGTAKPTTEPTAATGAVAASNAAQHAAPASPAELANVCEFVKVLDLSKLPAPAGATVGQQSPTHLEVSVPLAVPAAVEFYVDKLDALGWKRVAAADADTDSFAQMNLSKDGYLLLLTAISGQPKQSGITIQQVGNFDSRTLPRIDGAEDQYSSQSNSLYFTSATVDKATAGLRKLFKTDGWQEYDQAFSQKAVRPDASDLLFYKKGYSVTVSISKSPAKPEKSAVQYSVATLARDLPSPADAGHVEIDDSRWILMCEVPRDRKDVANYYRKALQEIGFSASPHEASSDKALTLSFESPDHDLVVVSLTAAAEHGTKVRLEGYSAAFREALKKAEVADRLKREAQEKAEAEAKAERVKAFKESSKEQDDLIKSAVGNALKDATQPKQPSELSKKIQADVKAKVEKALQEQGESPNSKPDDKPAK